MSGVLRHVLSGAVKKRLAVPIEATEIGNVFKFSDGRRYRVAAAAIVERTPVIVPDLPQWLTAYGEFKAKRDAQLVRGLGEPIPDANQKLNAAALASKAGAAAKKDAGKAKSAPGKSAPAAAAAGDKAKAASNASDAFDGSDAFEFDPTLEDLARFQAASRLSDADASNDVRSVRRAYGHSLFLTVKKNRAAHAWAFPQGGYEPDKDGAHLRNAAQRELAEECGPALRVYFYGHAPIFHTEYLFDDAGARAHHKADGTKVFFYPAVYLGGDVQLDAAELEDYQWMKLDELVANLAPSVGALCRNVFFDPFTMPGAAAAAASATKISSTGN
jgi:large subunit ribosomal protein L46